jgi:hypothetical protein
MHNFPVILNHSTRPLALHVTEFVHSEFSRNPRRGLELLTGISQEAKTAFFALLSPPERKTLVDCLLYFIEEAPRPTLDILAETDGQTKSDFHALLPKHPNALRIFLETANVRDKTALIWLAIAADYDNGIQLLRQSDNQVCELLLRAFARHPPNHQAFLALTRRNYPDIYNRLEGILKKSLPLGKANAAPSEPTN